MQLSNQSVYLSVYPSTHPSYWFYSSGESRLIHSSFSSLLSNIEVIESYQVLRMKTTVLFGACGVGPCRPLPPHQV